MPRWSSSSRATCFMTRARGSNRLYTRWPKPMRRKASALSLARATAAGMFAGVPMSCSILSTASLAPPWAGPHREDTPAATQANGLAWDDPADRTVVVDAFCSWSRCRTSSFSRARAHTGSTL